MAEEVGESKNTIFRYIRLTELIPELLDLVDEGRIAFRPAVELSYLQKEEQRALLEQIAYADATPSLAQAIKLKRFSQDGKLNNEVIESIMSEEKPNQREKINIKYAEARRFIPASVPYEKTGEYHVVPNSQSAAVEWNSVTNKSFSNILKKFNVTVTKSDCEVGTAQGDASLAGAAYGIYKGDQLVDTYYTDENGQFTTGYYVCGDDWTIREISPSEGYLLDSTVYPVGAEAANYTVELNAAPAVAVAEQVQKGNIAIIKHSDNGDTQIETLEEGAAFAVYTDA